MFVNVPVAATLGVIFLYSASAVIVEALPPFHFGRFMSKLLGKMDIDH